MPFIPSARQLIDQILESGEVILASQIGAANGVAGLDENGDIVATAIHRVNTAANLAAITLKNGEIAIASDTNDILRGDGSTLGGVLVQGGIRSYQLGPVELLSTTSDPAHTTNVALTPGLYRMWGVAGFSGDTDNLSNFLFVSGTTTGSVDTSMVNTIGTAGGTFKWRFAKNTFFEPPTILDWWPLSLPSFALFSAIPPSLVESEGRCEFDVWLPVTIAGIRPFTMRLRTTKVGTPTIMGSYRLCIQRVA